MNPREESRGHFLLIELIIFFETVQKFSLFQGNYQYIDYKKIKYRDNNNGYYTGYKENA